jgi:hypothetical protein
MNLKGDKIVNACIESKLKREKYLTKKSSTIVQSFAIIKNLVKTN